MVANLETEAHLLHIKNLVVEAIFLSLLCLLVVKLAPVDYLADRRVGIWRNLDKVEFLLLRKHIRFARAHNAELFAICIDDPYLWCPNLSVQARTRADFDFSLVTFLTGSVTD
jgi:hypothetical protein